MWKSLLSIHAASLLWAFSAAAVEFQVMSEKQIKMEVSHIEAASALGPQGEILLGSGEASVRDFQSHTLHQTGAPPTRCVFQVTYDQGQTWSKAHAHQREDFFWSLNPAVAVSPNGILYALCLSLSQDYKKGVLEFARSVDQGVTWSLWTEMVSRTSGFPDKPALVVLPDESLVLSFSDYEKTRSGTLIGRIKTMRSYDQGKTWSTPQALVKGVGVSTASTARTAPLVEGDLGVSLSASETEVFASWGTYSKSIYFSKSQDAGKTWNKPVLLSPAAPSGPITQLVVDPSGERVAVLWHSAHSLTGIFVATSADGGINWSSPLSIDDRGGLPTGVIDSKRHLHITWLKKELRGMSLMHTRVQDFSHPEDFQSWVVVDRPMVVPTGYVGSSLGFLFHPDQVFHSFWLDWTGAFPSIAHTQYQVFGSAPDFIFLRTAESSE